MRFYLKSKLHTKFLHDCIYQIFSNDWLMCFFFRDKTKNNYPVSSDVSFLLNNV